ncbi:hypothetical protein [Kosmotoga arenicorallina]|nr:hypothetical protein [Kosmotoga arenicorallina]
MIDGATVGRTTAGGTTVDGTANDGATTGRTTADGTRSTKQLKSRVTQF